MWELTKVKTKKSKKTNSISAKFDRLKCLISNHVDILVLTETKLDEMFTTSSFLIDGFSSPFWLDWNRKGGSILIYVRSDIPSNLLTKHTFLNDIKGLFAVINFRKSKWSLFRTYHPPSQNDQYYFDCLDKALDVYSSYEKFILTGDFNMQESKCVFDSFLYQHDLTYLGKEGICLKNQRIPSCIDLYLTNSPLSFQNTSSVFTGLSDFLKLVLTVFKTTFVKSKNIHWNSQQACTCEKEVGEGKSGSLYVNYQKIRIRN